MGGGGRPLRTRGGGVGCGEPGGGGARLDWVVGACVGAACMAEKRAKIGRVSVENQPVFGNNTHLGALSAVVTRQIDVQEHFTNTGNRLYIGVYRLPATAGLHLHGLV